MNIQQLEYIIALDQHQHFAKAADKCAVTQATLSGMLKKLEHELGFQIFDRSHQPSTTTEKGREVVALAHRIIELKQEMLELGTVSNDDLEGTLKIGIIPTIANSLLPLILPTILKKFPALRLKIEEITTEEITRRLKNGEIDLGILATPLQDETIDETILYYEPMMVYGAESSTEKYVSTKSVKDNKIWLLEEGHCFRNQAITICNVQEKQGEDNLQFNGSTFETLLNLADHFGGITLVPELYYLDMEKKKKQKTKPFQSPIPVREISLISYRPATYKSAIKLLSQEITNQVTPILSTGNYNKSELEIVGI